MSGIGFGVSSTGSLVDALSEIPAEILGYFRLGFARISKVNNARWSAIIDAISKISSPHTADLEVEGIVSVLEIEGDEIHHLVNASRLLLGILAFRTESVEEIISAMLKVNILSEESKDDILAFGSEAAGNREGLKHTLSLASLQHALLPSLMELEIKVDFRLGFDGNKVSRVAPVVLVHLDTDAVNQEVWFQLTPSQVEGFIARLERALKQMNSVDPLLKSLMPS